MNSERDEYVPRDAKDLFSMFSEDIVRHLQKRNRVRVQHEDLVQHTWTKLLEVRILEKYQASAVLPRTMTGAEAAAFLGMAFPSFKVLIWRGVRGDMRKKRLGSNDRTKSEWAPQPLKGGWASKKAVYATSDLQRLRTEREKERRCKQVVPVVVPEGKVRFRAYLMQTVDNIFKNWCRWQSRKWLKDVVVDPHEDGTPWEVTQRDNYHCDPEQAVALKEVLDQIEVFEQDGRSAVLSMRGNRRVVSGLNEKANVYRSFVGRDQELVEAVAAE